MKKRIKKLLIILLIITLAIFFILIIKFPQPCDYQSNAIMNVKKTCDCVGIKIKTSHDLVDERISYGCIGIAVNHKCYGGGVDYYYEKDC